MKFEYFKDTRGEWRWRFKAANGEIVAVSSEGYTRKESCLHSIDLMKQCGDAPVYEV